MSRYLGLFVAEASEHLEALGRDLVSLEGTPNVETVDSLFRHAHSVKGMAASMGLEPIAQLAHRVEDLVDVARRLPGALGRERVDLLLTTTDTMIALVRGTGEGNAPAPQPDLLAKLGDAVVALTGQAPRPTKVAPVDPLAKPAAAPLGAVRLEVRFRILEAAQSPGPRAFLVYKKLTGLGAERFDDEVGGAGLDRLHHQRLLAERRADDHDRLGVATDDLPRGLDAALVRHHDVHGREVRLQGPVLLDGLDAVRRLTHDLVPAGAEDVADHVPHEHRVVDDQHSLRHGRWGRERRDVSRGRRDVSPRRPAHRRPAR